ncbi:hypothetical protein [uncultured Nostoc sp.]|uniref:hypothetical protein n=1 Tax=uncultured Nostoc sp. TaxID=340711 RepID=UPI0035C981CA
MKVSDRTYGLLKSLNSWDIFIAGVAVVVAASTLISDITGYFTFGIGFAIAIALAFIVNLFLGMSAADLSVAYPRWGDCTIMPKKSLAVGSGNSSVYFSA